MRLIGKGNVDRKGEKNNTFTNVTFTAKVDITH